MKIDEVIKLPPRNEQERWLFFQNATLSAISNLIGQEIDEIPPEAMEMISNIYKATEYPDIDDTAEKVVSFINTL